MSKYLKMIIGGVLIVLGVYLCYVWWFSLWQLIKGGLGILLILIGLITIAVAGE